VSKGRPQCRCCALTNELIELVHTDIKGGVPAFAVLDLAEKIHWTHLDDHAALEELVGEHLAATRAINVEAAS
jgi:hypothetical protein